MTLSPREKEICEMVAKGQTDKQIARRLGITEDTVNTHLRFAFEKLESTNRTQAVVRAFTMGWINV
jgi:LuxR family maltose regulon positive regulatory protein